MKFSMSVEKKNRNTIGQVAGHNLRAHSTKSQLPKSAWFTVEGKRELTAWDANLLEKSKSLSVRKDSVLAIQLILQVGNQEEWREKPTADYPFGRPINNCNELLDNLCEGALAAAIAEFGAERLISVVLHTDETSPHLHVLVAPIVDNKLNAKKWLNGPAACGSLRERLHTVVNKHIECDYEKGAPGGLSHNPSLARDGIIKTGLLNKIREKVSGESDIKSLRSALDKANRDLQSSFSSLKRSQLNAIKSAKDSDDLLAKSVNENKRLTESARKQIKILSDKVAELNLVIERLTPKPAKTEAFINDIYNRANESKSMYVKKPRKLGL